jgi:hypothetical protein
MASKKYLFVRAFQWQVGLGKSVPYTIGGNVRFEKHGGEGINERCVFDIV